MYHLPMYEDCEEIKLYKLYLFWPKPFLWNDLIYICQWIIIKTCCFLYGAEKTSFEYCFFLSTFVLFSVKGSVVSLFAPAIIPDSESDTEGSTRTMRLLKLHYHQQQVSNWSLFCTIFETNKQTKIYHIHNKHKVFH